MRRRKGASAVGESQAEHFSGYLIPSSSRAVLTRKDCSQGQWRTEGRGGRRLCGLKDCEGQSSDPQNADIMPRGVRVCL